MRTLLIDTDRLGPVLLREAPRRLERDGSPVTSAEGEPVLMGRLVLPGGAKSAYAENPTPTQVRLKVLGSDRGLKPGVVRLGGRVTVTRWFQRGPRGGQSKSELTVSAERIEPTQGPATVTGWLPVAFLASTEGDHPLLLGETPLDGGGWRAYLSLPAGSVEGVAEVDTKVPVSHLVGSYVRPTLWAKLIQPDVEDLSRAVKAELPLLATGWEAAGYPGQVDDPKPRGRERQEAQPAEAVTP